MIQNQWSGGTVTIAKNTANSYTIAYAGVPAQACSLAVNGLTAVATAIYVNNIYVSDPSGAFAGSPVLIDAATVAAACKAGGGTSTITMYFQ